MTMINDSGVIVDPTELAAVLETSVEELQTENQQILSASLEDLLSAIETQVDHGDIEDVPSEFLTPAMESVLSIARDIQASGAISRSDAQTLRTMTTSLEGLQESFETLPLNSYTEMPSKVNFDASMESVFGNIGRKILEVIKSIIKWIREKAKAFVGLFRTNRVKAKQVEEAAKKVDDALTSSIKVQRTADWEHVARNYAQASQNVQDVLDSMKANQGEWDKLRQKLGEKHMDGWAKGAAERAKMNKVQLDLPMLASSVAYGDRAGNVNKACHLLVILTIELTGSIVASTTYTFKPSTFDNLVELDKLLFEDSQLKAPEHTLSGASAALRHIVARLNAEAADVDVLTVDNPEHVLNQVIASFNLARLSNMADRIAIQVTKSNTSYTARSSALEAEIQAAVKRGETVPANDPRVEEVNNLRTASKIGEDLDAIYRAIMNAFSKVTRIGAELAKNPAAVKAA